MGTAQEMDSTNLKTGSEVSKMRINRDAANYTLLGYENGLVEIRATNDLSYVLYSFTYEETSKVVDIRFFKDEWGSLHVVYESGWVYSTILTEHGDDTFEFCMELDKVKVDEDANYWDKDVLEPASKIYYKMIRFQGDLFFAVQTKQNELRLINMYDACF